MWQETNTYSARATALEQFEDFELLDGEAILERHQGTGSVAGGFIDGLAEASGNRQPVGVFSAAAWPGGPPGIRTTDELLRRLDDALQQAPDVDGVLVNLHGAMVADGASDMELETLRRVRARFRRVPVAAVMDLHANPSPAAVHACDAVVGYRTYPHVDMHACGTEAAGLLERALGGERLVTAHGRLAELTSPVAQGTGDAPMQGLLERAERRAHEAGALRVSLFPGFPYSDADRVGFSVTTVARAEEAAGAIAVTGATLADVQAHIGEFAKALPDPAAAVAKALGAQDLPVVLADVADNIGGGGPGDGTAILAELIAQRAQGAVVLLVDAPAVAAAEAAGVGAELDVTLGGRTDLLHGPPVRARARVVRLGDGRYRSEGSYMTGQEFSMGPTAVLEVGGVVVVAMSRATPPFHLEQLTANGIDPGAASVIAVKGAVAWRDPYRPVTGSFIEVDTPGCCPADPYRLARSAQPSALEPATA
jgi:microcystin degradation protein MlrC